MKVLVNHLKGALNDTEATYIKLGTLKKSTVKTLEKHFPAHTIVKCTDGYWQFKPKNLEK